MWKFILTRAGPSHHAFGQAQSIYESYEKEIGLSLLGPTDEQQEAARKDADLNEAERLYELALSYCVAKGQDHNVGAVHFQIGLLNRLRAQHDLAIARFEKAVGVFERLVSAHSEVRTFLSMGHFYLGQCLLEVGRRREAKHHLLLAIPIDELLSDFRRIEAAKTLLERCSGGATPEEREDGLASSRGRIEVEQKSDAVSRDHSSPPLSRPATLWIVSRTAVTTLRLRAIVDAGLAGLPTVPVVITTALNETNLDRHPAGSLREDPSLCAVVLGIVPSILDDQSFLQFLAWCIDQVASRDDFRLFVLLEGLSPRDLEARANQTTANSPLRRLPDTVQLAHSITEDALRRDLRAYVTHLEEARSESVWHRMRLTTATWAGAIATVLQILCLLPASVLVFWLPVWNPHANLRQFQGHENVVALICGIASFALLTLGLFAYTRYSLLLRMTEDRFGPLWAGLFSFLGVPIFVSAFRINASLGWIALGCFLGAVLDALRRAGYRARRERRQVDPSKISQKHERLPRFLREQAGRAWLNPLRCPLLPFRSPNVFVSYTRASDWGSRVAQEIDARLQAFGIKTFLYQRDVPEGASWRRYLNHHLGRSNVFIAVADGLSVEREWPAAEMEAALEGKHLTGLPEIVVVKSPSLPYSSAATWTWLPAFRSVVYPHHGTPVEGQPRILEYTAGTAEAVALLFHPDVYTSISVVPVELARVLRATWVLLSVPLSLASTLAAVAGHLAFVLFFVEVVWKLNSAAWLAKLGLFDSTFLLCGFWIGNLVRLALAARFHLRIQRARGVFRAHRDAAIGLIVLLIFWTPRSPNWVLGWACFAAVVGWAIAAQFCTSQARKDPGFLGPDE